MMSNYPQIDAYRVLGLYPGGSDEEIRLAYHRKIKDGEEERTLAQAYELIRDAKARERYQWNSLYSYFSLFACEEGVSSSLEEVIKEVAFLSDWELGDLDER